MGQVARNVLFNAVALLLPSIASVVTHSVVETGANVQTMREVLAIRKASGMESCSGKAVSDRGGWCLRKPDSAELGHHFTHNNAIIPIPAGHVLASESIVKELILMIESENITSINDFGAGVGQYKYAILSSFPHFKYLAYDGAANVEEYTNGFANFFDLTIPMFLSKADWVVCLEVGEHIHPKYEGMMIRNLDRHNCKGIVLSWGILGQGGTGHVNDHSNEYIIQIFTDLGYFYDRSKTEKMRYLNSYSWFQNSTMVFRRYEAVC